MTMGEEYVQGGRERARRLADEKDVRVKEESAEIEAGNGAGNAIGRAGKRRKWRWMSP